MAWFWYAVPIMLTLLLQVSGVMNTAENTLEDRFFQTGSRVSPEIYVIGIDEESLAYYGAFHQWGREKIAEMVRYLTRDEASKPAVIAIDVGFYGQKEADSDRELTEAVRDAGNVVLVSAAAFGTVLRDEPNGTFSGKNQVILFDEPFPALKQAARAIGHSNVQTDSDGFVRHAAGDLTFSGTNYPSFAYQIYAQYTGQRDRDFARKDKGFYIRYAGKPHDYYGAVGAGCSFRKVLSGEYPSEAFAGNIVLIGAYASGMQDQYFTSVSHGTPMYGVEIQANIVQQLLDNADVREMAQDMRIFLTMAVGILTGAFLIFLRTRISIGLSVFGAVCYLLGIRILYRENLVICPVFYVPLVVTMLVIGHIAVRYFAVYREKKKMIADYGRYLSPEIAAAIADTGNVPFSLGGRKKDIAVLFVDIRNFTTLSEEFRPEKVVEMLNRYLGITTDGILRNKGTVDKFIGDATMGLFNAPLDLEDYTYRAVCAGLYMAEQSGRLKNGLPDEMKGRVGFGIGINCGEAIVGNIGTDFRMEYTAIGDTVNTAARLEGQAGAGEVIISREVYDRVCSRIECEDRGMVRLKGKTEAVHIYRALRVKE
ncbi:adenylate cyclase [[Clostridium] aminophilum]|uniref:Adenylate cyclase n=1 Tax=[Clostridium] aminophilum TaxID=1526 RepID=A0A1I0DML5_9FIRM|nr:adenylate/guanylate cyclase domain-containing protein [[Clostridium] aminophilum]SET33357.1 adenylate cyclase [[Clostridium] aminophilum]